MTLNITLVTRDRIFQSSDYRLTDLQTGRVRDFETQKMFGITRRRWRALVCFAGVGATKSVDVRTWTAHTIKQLPHDAPVSDLLEGLKMADSWLSEIPAQRHWFTVGAFVDDVARLFVVTNEPGPRMAVTETHLTEVIVSVQGARNAVTERNRRSLRELVTKKRHDQEIYDALKRIHATSATRSTLVSAACCIAHLNNVGQGQMVLPEHSGAPIDVASVLPAMGSLPFDPELAALIRGRTLKSVTFAHGHFDEVSIRRRLREQPSSADLRANLSSRLLESGRLEEAQEEVDEALRLQKDHPIGLVNNAHLALRRGDDVEAERRYLAAIAACPGQLTYDAYLRFLFKRKGVAAALAVAEEAVSKAPQSGFLMVWLGELRLQLGNPEGAITAFRAALNLNEPQKNCLTLLACAMHMAGEPDAECIGAYETAIAVTPDDGDAHLNLAQLLFARGAESQARKHLRKAETLGLQASAKLELLFYKACHAGLDPNQASSEARPLLAGGHRLDWDVSQNISYVAARNPSLAERLVDLEKEMRSGQRIPADPSPPRRPLS